MPSTSWTRREQSRDGSCRGDPASTDWTSLFDVDFDNIRGAINWYFDVNRTELGLEIAARLWKYFRYGWHIRDGIQWLTQGLERAPVASTPVRALAFLGLGVLQEAAGELDSARADADAAYALYQELHDDYGMAISAALVGELALFQGDLDGAETMCRVAQHYFLGEEFVSWAPFIWKTLGHVARLRGDREAADASFQESLRMAQKLDNRWGEAEALVGMAETHMQTGELSTLAGWLRDALHHYLPSIDPLCVGVALGDVAELAARALMPVEALTIVAAEDRYHRETGYQLTGILASPHIMALQFAQMRLSKDEFNVSWSAGAALSISETVEVAHRIVGDIWSRQQQTISSISWADSPGALSARELDVLRLLPAGKTDQEIADTLFIARRTVTTHVGAILAKLGVANRTEAAAKAVNDGII